MNPTCTAVTLPDWLAGWMPSAPFFARAVMGIGIFLVLVISVWLQSPSSTSVVVRFAPRGRCLRRLTVDLAPALCAILVFAALLVSLSVAGYFQWPPTGHTGFLATVDPAEANSPSEMVARAVWATTYGAVIICTIGVCWVSVGIWRNTASLGRWRAAFAFGVLAILLAAVLIALGYSGHLLAFGSGISDNMLCRMWTRNGDEHLGPVTDALNTVGVFVSVLVAGSFCLLSRAIRCARDRLALNLGSRQRLWLRWRADLVRTRRIQDLMDHVLYVSAAVLMAGLLEVVAALSWSYVPFPSGPELKVQIDLCKALHLPSTGSAQAIRTPTPPKPPACLEEAKNRFKNSEKVDELRRFTRSIAIVFGASFSILLAAMYLPVATAHQQLVRALTLGKPTRKCKDTLLTSSAEKEHQELERSMVQRMVNILATLGPLAIAIVSTVFGL